MKKIVFIFSVLCFLAITSVNAQSDNKSQNDKYQSKKEMKEAQAKKKAYETRKEEMRKREIEARKAAKKAQKEKEMQDERNNDRIDAATQKEAEMKAAHNPNIVVRKKGNETYFFRRTKDRRTEKEVLKRVIYNKKTGEFEVPEKDNQFDSHR